MSRPPTKSPRSGGSRASLPLLGLLALGLCGAADPARGRAPTLVDGRSGKQVKELSRRVDATIRGVLAETTVTLALRSLSGRDEEAVLHLAPPPGAAVTKLEMKFNGRWTPAAMLASDAVRRHIQKPGQLKGRPDPAWLELVAPGRYRLRVFPVPARGRIELRYRYVHTLTLSWGQRRYILPRRGKSARLATAIVTLTDWPLGGGAAKRYRLRVASTATLEKPLVEPRIPAGRPLRAAFFVAPSPAAGRPGHGLLLLQGNPDAARRRWGADVVFLVDRSRSMWTDSHQSAAAVIRGVLGQLGAGTRFGLVSFNQRTGRFTSRLVAGSRSRITGATRWLKRQALANGSAIDQGLKAAYGLFGSGRSARRRLLVVLTDGLLPERKQNTVLWPDAPAGTEVLALVGRPHYGLDGPRTEGPLSRLAVAQGGVAYAFDPMRFHEVRGGAVASHQATRRLTASLARPGRLSNLAVSIGGQLQTLPRKEVALLGGLMHYLPVVGAAPKQATIRYGYWGKRQTERLSARAMPASWRAALNALYRPRSGLAVSQRRSLVVVHPQDAFGQDRLRFARRWGDRFFLRLAPQGAVDLPVGPFGLARRQARAPSGSSGFSPGRLTKKIVRRLINTTYLKQATRCYQATGPHFRKGRAVLYLDLTRGEVADAWVDHARLPQPGLRKCLVTAALSLRVAHSWGDETLYRVIYPMNFRPEDGSAREIRGWRPPPRQIQTNPLRGLDD